MTLGSCGPYVDIQSALRTCRPTAPILPAQKQTSMPRDDWKPLQKWTCNLGLQSESILHGVIQAGKYMNTFCFIRRPQRRLHGHFYSAPTLEVHSRPKASDGQTKTSIVAAQRREDSAYHFKGTALFTWASVATDRATEKKKSGPTSRSWNPKHEPSIPAFLLWLPVCDLHP